MRDRPIRGSSSNRAAALLLWGCVACSGPSALGTARTLDAGAFDHVVGLDYGRVERCETDMCGAFYFLGPSYALRYGALGFLEPGLRLSVPDARLDLKTELFRSRLVDLALDPWVSGAPNLDENSRYLDLRAGLQALVDLNLTEELSLVLSGGPATGASLAQPEVIGEASVGLDIRYLSQLRFHPQVGVRGIPGRNHGPVETLQVGLGLGFGARPSFGSGPRPLLPAATASKTDPGPEQE